MRGVIFSLGKPLVFKAEKLDAPCPGIKSSTAQSWCTAFSRLLKKKKIKRERKIEIVKWFSKFSPVGTIILASYQSR